MRKTERSDIKEWLEKLDDASKGRYGPLWKSVYRQVDISRRRRIAVNLYSINKHTDNGDNIIVPGKVLSKGTLGHKVNITAISFSEKAKAEIKRSDSKILSLNEMLGREKVKIIR